MNVEQPVARRATALLLAVAGGDPSAVPLYDGLLFPLLFDIAQRRGRYLAASAAARLGLDVSEPAGAVPQVRSADLEEVAAVAAETALLRARAAALRFDPKLGDGASWAIGALGPAYLDAARGLARSRRRLVELPLDELEDLPRSAAGLEDPESLAEVRDGLERALASLTDDERYVIIAKLHYGLTYREIALYLFGDETATKSVDRLLQSARGKLRAAHEAWTSEA